MKIKVRIWTLLVVLIISGIIGIAIGYIAPTFSNSNNKLSTENAAFIVNGKDKSDTLIQNLGYTYIKLTVKDESGNIVMEVEDVLSKNTDLDKILKPGKYELVFSDKNGNDYEQIKSWNISIN
ncbi:hypothetical protein KC852_02240 [Candidatus Nomurabacteria bacterium]|nr:hypothetical protein [Candidatus Nomurabacteria bacterium]